MAVTTCAQAVIISGAVENWGSPVTIKASNLSQYFPSHLGKGGIAPFYSFPMHENQSKTLIYLSEKLKAGCRFEFTFKHNEVEVKVMKIAVTKTASPFVKCDYDKIADNIVRKKYFLLIDVYQPIF